MGSSHNAAAVLAEIKKDFQNWEGFIFNSVVDLGNLAMKELQNGSPIDTGQYKASHDLSLHSPSRFRPPFHTRPLLLPEDARTESNPIPAYAALWPAQLSKASAVLRSLSSGSGFAGGVSIPRHLTFYITNNSTHAWDLENGKSKKKPVPIYEGARKRLDDLLISAVGSAQNRRISILR